MRIDDQFISKIAKGGLFVSILLALYLTSLYSYLLFHTLVEFDFLLVTATLILLRNRSPVSSNITITVKDNGIGFEEQYAQRIFQPFQRLHGRGDYEGTGLGLSICQKIFERHQGKIEAHSRPGEGTQFIIPLPADLVE